MKFWDNSNFLKIEKFNLVSAYVLGFDKLPVMCLFDELIDIYHTFFELKDELS